MKTNLEILAEKIVGVQRDIDISQDRCFDLESEIEDLKSELAEEEGMLSDLQDELDNLLEVRETLDPLTEIVEQSYNTDIIVSDVLHSLDKEGRIAYILTQDRNEIERAAGKNCDGIGFALIHYEEHIPVIMWGGQGIADPDAPLRLLHYSGVAAVDQKVVKSLDKD